MSLGDLILDAPDIDRYFEPSKETLLDCDLLVGQVEVPHTNRGQWCNPESHSAPPADPENLNVLSSIGLKVATCGGNHIFDQGPNGVEDTLSKLRELGIQTAGAGMNLSEARRPAVYEVKGVKYAVLEYNTVGPAVSWATPMKAGAAFLKVNTLYENDKAEPGGAPSYIYTITDPGSMNELRKDIRKAKEIADVVLCYFHMGRMNSTEILNYQREITHAAIDEGAQMVCCHHSHCMLGVEVYKGRPIYYGLGHFVAVTDVANPSSPYYEQLVFNPFDSAETRPFWKIEYKLPSEKIPYYMFDENSRKTMIAKALFSGGELCYASVIPCYIDAEARPVPVTAGSEKGEEIMAYLRSLCREEELPEGLWWSCDNREIVFLDKRGKGSVSCAEG